MVSTYYKLLAHSSWQKYLHSTECKFCCVKALFFKLFFEESMLSVLNVFTSHSGKTYIRSGSQISMQVMKNHGQIILYLTLVSYYR